MRRKTRAKKIEKNKKCPYCHRERMEIITTYRLNYPFGVNSKPRFTPIRKEKFCSKCGEIY